MMMPFWHKILPARFIHCFRNFVEAEKQILETFSLLEFMLGPGVREMKSGILAGGGKVAIGGKAIVGEMSSDSPINHQQQSQE